LTVSSAKWISEINHGKKKRFIKSEPKNNPDGSVTFLFTLVEPIAVEEDIHVTYGGEVVYSVPKDVARTLARNDLRIFRQSLDKEISTFPLLHAQYSKAETEEKLQTLTNLVKELQDNINNLSNSAISKPDPSTVASADPQVKTTETKETSKKRNKSEYLFYLLVPILGVVLSSFVAPLVLEWMRHRRDRRKKEEEKTKIILPN